MLLDNEDLNAGLQNPEGKLKDKQINRKQKFLLKSYTTLQKCFCAEFTANLILNFIFLLKMPEILETPVRK